MNGDVLQPGAELETVFDGGFYLEGPAEGPDGRIYFCDITMTFRSGMAAGNIWAFDPSTGRAEIFRSPSGMAAGIKFDRQGRMVVATGADFGGRAVIRTDMASGQSHILAGLYGGRPFNAPNDLVIDRKGRIYFTDPRYMGHEPVEQPVFGVYRIDPEGETQLVLADVSKPNGIDLSPDQRTLYVVDHDVRILDPRIATAPPRDTGAMRILAYDLHDGWPTGGRVLVEFGAEKGADGMAVDAEGRLYAAVKSLTRPGVRVYHPNGDPIVEIPTPLAPSNCTLVGTDQGSDLYITAGSTLYRIGVQAAPCPSV